MFKCIFEPRRLTTLQKIQSHVDMLWQLRHRNVLTCYGYAGTKGIGDYGAIVYPVSTWLLTIYYANGIQWRGNGDSRRTLSTKPLPLRRTRMVCDCPVKNQVSHARSFWMWLALFSIFIIVNSQSFMEI